MGRGVGRATGCGLVVGVVGMRFRDWIGGTKSFGFVHGAHVFSEGVGTGKGAVTLYIF